MNLSPENLNIMAGISHEIRNPINAIIGISHLLQNEKHRHLHEDLVQTLLMTAENLRELTTNILDFTKLEQGKVPRNLALVDIRKDLPTILYAQETVARAKGLELVTEIAENVPPLVLLDRVRGMQILVNLVSNAIKFTQEGRITVLVKVLEINPSQVTLYFGVRDTGMGIPEEIQQQIFEPFRQGGGNISLKHGGTGLGLSIAKMLIDGAGGRLKLESKVGQGSEFSFIIPLGLPDASVKEIPKEKAVSPKEVLGDRKILLVDDNKVNLLVTGKTLDNWGITHSIARNGLEAVEMIQREDFAAVLMDLHMPEMDGYDAICAIRNLADEKFLSLPVIALSGSTGFLTIDEVRATGFTEFLAKPYKPQELLEMIIRVLKEQSKKEEEATIPEHF